MPKSSTSDPLDQLTALSSRDEAKIRPALLRAITDLYVQKQSHTAEEQNQYIELALGLLIGADAQTRSTVASILRNYPAAPPEVLRQLSEKDSAENGAGTSKRAAALSTHDDLIELFFTATPEERRLIVTNLEVAISTSQPAPFLSADAAMRLEEAIAGHESYELTRLLERAVGVSRILAERIVNDASGEPLVVLAKAIGMTAASLQRLLLSLNPGMGKSVTRMLMLTQLFEEIPTPVAAYMLLLWQRTNERMTASYEAVHWNDEHRDARSWTITAPHGINRDRYIQPGRLKVNTR